MAKAHPSAPQPAIPLAPPTKKNKAKYGGSAPSFAPAGAREGGGREGGGEEASCKAIPQASAPKAISNQQ